MTPPATGKPPYWARLQECERRWGILRCDNKYPSMLLPILKRKSSDFLSNGRIDEREWRAPITPPAARQGGCAPAKAHVLANPRERPPSDRRAQRLSPGLHALSLAQQPRQSGSRTASWGGES